MDRALEWLSQRQARDGSFPSRSSAQPAVTSLAALAYLSRGHQPGQGPYGEQLNRAIDFVLTCQKADGLLCLDQPEPAYINRAASHTAYYNHGIAGLMLTEAYGQISGPRSRAVRTAVEKALAFSRESQLARKPAADRGGWRYPHIDTPALSDVSVTAWQLMFLRSAKNAEFEVPVEYVTDAIAFVRRCWDPQSGMFYYALPGPSYGGSRGVVAAGIVSLSMAGQHETEMAFRAGDWLMARPFRNYGEISGPRDKFIYATYYTSQAAAQLGGKYWERIFPQIADVLLRSQGRDGSWPPEADLTMFGPELTTAMAVLSLTPPYQLLPVYQR